LIKSEKPLFFIQEFLVRSTLCEKRAQEYSNPRTQLLAELISGVELSGVKQMKGAYIVGSIWNFVILEKLDTDRYKYYISQKFDSVRLDDLKAIYTNLLFVKDEIIEKIRKEKKS
jgi:hypothetical protein